MLGLRSLKNGMIYNLEAHNNVLESPLKESGTAHSILQQGAEQSPHAINFITFSEVQWSVNRK